MKKLSYLILLCLFIISCTKDDTSTTSSVNSFNRGFLLNVSIYDSGAGYNYHLKDTMITVPINKTWKLTSIGTNSNNYGGFYVNLNGMLIYSIGTSIYTCLPLYLGSGNYKLSFAPPSINSYYAFWCNWFVSVVEYNN